MSLSIAVGESVTYNNPSESNAKYRNLLKPSLGAPGGYHHHWGPETIQQAMKLLVESSGRPEISLSGGNSQACQLLPHIPSLTCIHLLEIFSIILTSFRITTSLDRFQIFLVVLRFQLFRAWRW
jgi:hypothetical protein